MSQDQDFKPGDSVLLLRPISRFDDPLGQKRVATVHAVCPPYLVLTGGDCVRLTDVAPATPDTDARLKIIAALNADYPYVGQALETLIFALPLDTLQQAIAAITQDAKVAA